MPSTKHDVQRSSYLIFLPLLFVALILEILHLPSLIEDFRPDFTMLILLYFAITDPKRVNVGMAWFSGILLDILSGAPLGLNALSLCTQLFVILVSFRSFYNFLIWQQCVVILIVNFFINVLVHWLEHLFSNTGSLTSSIWPSVITACIWPIVYAMCFISCSLLSVSNKNKKNDDSL